MDRLRADLVAVTVQASGAPTDVSLRGHHVSGGVCTKTDSEVGKDAINLPSPDEVLCYRTTWTIRTTVPT